MQQLTAEQFREVIALDPSWASKLTQPVEITEYCDMSNTGITHLSPLLHFKGNNTQGYVAHFERCPELKIAEGNFYGRVDFTQSDIRKIGDLVITQPDNDGIAAAFWNCYNLKVAEGNFPGSVSFSNSGIEKIGDLKTQHNAAGICATFWSCMSLKVAEGNYDGHVDFNTSGIERIGNLKIKPLPRGAILANPKPQHLADFSKCEKLHLPKEWLKANIKMDEELCTRSEHKIQIEEYGRRLMKNQPEIEI